MCNEMKRLIICFLVGFLAILILLVAYIFATPYGPYVREVFGVFTQMASSANKESPTWFYSQAKVISSEIKYLSKSLGSRGTIKLQYVSENGFEHETRHIVYSLQRELSDVAPGDTLRIRVCKHDPLIVRSSRFKVSNQPRCVGPSDLE